MEVDLTRERLLHAALEVFAAHGYHGASTRDICTAANAGNAAIHYHFRDKTGIYRELFMRMLDDFEQRMRAARIGSLRGREALRVYYKALMRPLAEDPGIAQQIVLYSREELQPTGLVDDLLPRGLQLQVELLGDVLRRELGTERLDAALQRLVISLHGLALIYVFKQRVIRSVLPATMDGPNWLGRLTVQLAETGESLIEMERRRRQNVARRRTRAA
ncbi:MAG: transcriptional regulator, TetR family [Panacagrimonas sp.]|jgi:AcrR family transcriptional regulator|nr:TetR/AcrR family transcriptional regulator [Panacagrimonas sp.]MCC2656850.1 transcriptional regulator, TetR family [Panacagrimonas sp.]